MSWSSGQKFTGCGERLFFCMFWDALWIRSDLVIFKTRVEAIAIISNSKDDRFLNIRQYSTRPLRNLFAVRPRLNFSDQSLQQDTPNVTWQSEQLYANDIECKHENNIYIIYIYYI